MKEKKRNQIKEIRKKPKEQNMPLGAAVEANREKKLEGPNFPAT